MALDKTIAINSVYRLLNIAVLFITTILLSRLMGVEGYGIFSLVIATVTIFNLFTSFGSDGGITYFIASGRITPAGVYWFVLRILIVQLVIAVTAAVLLIFIYNGAFLLSLSSLETVLAGMMLLLSISVTEKITALFNGYHLYTALNRFTLISNTAIVAILAIYGWMGSGAGATGYLLAFILLSFVQTIGFVITFRKVAGVSFSLKSLDATEIKNFRTYIAIIYTANVIQFLAYRVDYWILNYYHGEKEVGWYALAVKLVQFLWIVPNLLASILFPRVAGQLLQTGTENIMKLIRIMNMINMALAVIGVPVAGWLIPFFFGTEYQSSVGLFIWLLPGVLLFCITTVLAAFFSGINQSKINLYGSAICLLAVLLLDFLLIPAWGKTGAAIASTIAYSITAFYSVYAFCRITKQPLQRVLIPVKADWAALIQITWRFIGKGK
jgi:O-antigen/teichoic acid export membrane protein